MFGKKDKPVDALPMASTATAVPANGAALAPEGDKESVVAPAMTVRGDVDFEGVMRVEGEVQGKITGQGRLIVDPGGKVMGDVMAAEVVVRGTVQGNVSAAARLEVASTARIAGDIRAPELSVAKGAKLLGRLDIDSESLSLAGGVRPKAEEPAPVDALEKVL